MKDLSSITEKVNMAPGSEIFVAAADIPVFHYTAYKELTLFQLFSWNKNVYDFPGTFEDFISGLDADLIMQSCNKIFQNYQQIPSSEIWSDNAIDSASKMIKYHFEMEHFNDLESPLIICKQLMNLINTLQEWAKMGTKGLGSAPFKFYTNVIDTGNTFVSIKNEEQSRCIVRLFTINGLNIKDEQFCREVNIWIDSLIMRSTLISSISTRERHKFISAQKQKITTLIDFIKPKLETNS
jgi:hypothetical protein